MKSQLQMHSLLQNGTGHGFSYPLNNLNEAYLSLNRLNHGGEPRGGSFVGARRETHDFCLSLSEARTDILKPR